MTSRLLVADDSITIQKIVEMAFEIEDVEVEGVGDGQEAFDRIANFNPDIVLADADMPGLDGFELSSKIKSSPDTSSIKVLLLSSDFEDFDEARYQSCGADNHISKPFKSDDIVVMVNSLLGISSGDTGSTETCSPIQSGAQSSEENAEPSLEELLQSVENLSAENMAVADLEDEPLSIVASEGGSGSEGVTIDIPESHESLDQSEENCNDDEVMDHMIQGVEELKESFSPQEPEGLPAEEGQVTHDVKESLEFSKEPEIFAEVRPTKFDNLEELDSTFKKILLGGKQDLIHKEEVERPSELSSLGGIVPEPEDLLESITPGTFSEMERRPATPEDIKENLDCISDLSDQDENLGHSGLNLQDWSYESEGEQYTPRLADEVARLLQRSLTSSLEKEVSGLSDLIIKTVREMATEVMPHIARQVIREEIEKIKKQDML